MYCVGVKRSMFYRTGGFLQSLDKFPSVLACSYSYRVEFFYGYSYVSRLGWDLCSLDSIYRLYAYINWTVVVFNNFCTDLHVYDLYIWTEKDRNWYQITSSESLERYADCFYNIRMSISSGKMKFREGLHLIMLNIKFKRDAI